MSTKSNVQNKQQMSLRAINKKKNSASIGTHPCTMNRNSISLFFSTELTKEKKHSNQINHHQWKGGGQD